MKTILITGANRGIGLEMVNQYAQQNWRVLACSRSLTGVEKLEKLKNAYPHLEVFQLDVTSPSNIRSLAAQLSNYSVDILMNNAGVLEQRDYVFGNTDAASWLHAFQVNTMAPQLMAEAFINNVLKGQLKIIANISSVLGSIELNNDGKYLTYRATKAALNAVIKNMAINLKDQSVSVVALHPGWVKTDMGGADAEITTAESVKGIKNILNTLTLAKTGQFFKYDGTQLPW